MVFLKCRKMVRWRSGAGRIESLSRSLCLKSFKHGFARCFGNVTRLIDTTHLERWGAAEVELRILAVSAAPGRSGSGNSGSTCGARACASRDGASPTR